MVEAIQSEQKSRRGRPRRGEVRQKPVYIRTKAMGSGPEFKAGRRAVEVGFALEPIPLSFADQRYTTVLANTRKAIQTMDVLQYSDPMIERIIQALKEAADKLQERIDAGETVSASKPGRRYKAGMFAQDTGRATRPVELGRIDQIRAALHILSLVQNDPIVSRIISGMVHAIERQQNISQDEHAYRKLVS